MFVNMDLKYKHVYSDSIKKVFAIGKMDTQDGNKWTWHVATIVRVKFKNDYRWMVIDPVFSDILSVKEWYEYLYHNFSTNKQLRLYFTNSSKLGVLPGRYDEAEIVIPKYNNYFVDMMAWFESEVIKGHYSKK